MAQFGEALKLRPGDAQLLASAGAAEKKNVLWIYLEDVSGWFSCYGDKVIETPNIDALADSGTRFTRFYTPAGVCSASRLGSPRKSLRACSPMKASMVCKGSRFASGAVEEVDSVSAASSPLVWA